MDRDLRDDMLKLVRYKILFVKREYEHAFPEQEDLVSENMDGAAFTAWKVAEFIQELQRGETRVPEKWRKYHGGKYCGDGGGGGKSSYLILRDLPHEDKKYLRVYYEVMDRYPREKFKYEEQQIKVLEDIRDELRHKDGGRSGYDKPDHDKPDSGESGPVDEPDAGAQHGAENPAEEVKDPYNEIVHRLHLSKDASDRWREGFQRHSKQFGMDIAKAFNQFRTVGHLEGLEVRAKDITQALSEPNAAFDRRSFDRFTGKAVGDLRIYRFTKDKPNELTEIKAPPLYSIWGETREEDGEFRQRITGSNVTDNFVDPDDRDAIWKGLANTTLDLTFNAWTKELGMVSWVSFYQNHSNQMRSIGYEVGPYLLWVNQLLDPDMTPTMGPLEIGLPGDPVEIRRDQLILSCDFEQDIDGKHYFMVYAMHIDFDFDKGRAKFAGPVLKLKNERLGW